MSADRRDLDPAEATWSVIVHVLGLNLEFALPLRTRMRVTPFGGRSLLVGLVDDVDGSLLGRRSGAVDADLTADQILLAVRAEPLARADKPAGPDLAAL